MGLKSNYTTIGYCQTVNATIVLFRGLSCHTGHGWGSQASQWDMTIGGFHTVEAYIVLSSNMEGRAQEGGFSLDTAPLIRVMDLSVRCLQQ